MALKLSTVFILIILGIYVECQVDWTQDIKVDRWNKYGKETIEAYLNRKVNGNVAKNVILFLGDGMGLPTVTAGRIRKGQLKNRNGEEEVTNMEKLENVALSKVCFSLSNFILS